MDLKTNMWTVESVHQKSKMLASQKVYKTFKTFCCCHILYLLAWSVSDVLLSCGAFPVSLRLTVNLRAACLAKHWLRRERYSIASGQVAPWSPTALLIVWTRASWQQHPSSVSNHNTQAVTLKQLSHNLAFTFSLFLVQRLDLEIHISAQVP